MIIQEYKVCRLCNRPLKTLESRLRGYGDVCYQKLRKHPNRLFGIRGDSNVQQGKDSKEEG